MGLGHVLSTHRTEIIRKWNRGLLTKTGERYGKEPKEELLKRNVEAADAYYSALVRNDFSKIDRFIETISKVRLESGFTLSEVQRAFDLYRTIVVPILTSELKGETLELALKRVNRCLSYTTTRFSDYFQSLHEKVIVDHAQNLENEVIKRTKELSESEAKYRVLVEEINDGYFVVQDEKIVFANRAFCDMHGYDLPEVIDKPYTHFLSPESVARVHRNSGKRLSTGDGSAQYAYLRLHKDGGLLPTENKVKSVLYEGEKAYAGICRDITERVRLGERIRESERLAHIGQLTASLAHEIRNPLSSIKMSIQMILENVHFEGDNKRTMEISAKEISRLERILSEMLDFARPLRMAFEPTSVNEIVRSGIEILRTKMQEQNIRLEEHLSKDMNPMMVDGEKIEQAVINILLNSMDALHGGGVITVRTRHERKSGENFTVVEVHDDGPGVHKEDLPYIFDPFFSKKKKGTGLGLANVKKIAEAHNGTVTAMNTRRGFCLLLSLPTKKKHE